MIPVFGVNVVAGGLLFLVIERPFSLTRSRSAVPDRHVARLAP